jgi:hypothetical protein
MASVCLSVSLYCICMYVWMDGWMDGWTCTSLIPEQLDGFYKYSVFTSLSGIGRCPVNINISAPKIGALQMGLKTQNGDFLENGSNDIYCISPTCGRHLRK